MTQLVPVDDALLDHVLDMTYPIWHEGLDRRAYGRFHAARMRTAWGRRCQRRFALMDGMHLLASAEQYDLAGTFDRQPVRICGIGSVFTSPTGRGLGHARALVETLVEESAQSGAEIALLFPRSSLEDDVRRGFEAIISTEATLTVAESSRYGAPMTMVRSGEERDLAAIVAMGRVRAEPFRFHLDRDIDLVRYAITSRRLLAGLGSAHARQLHFVIAEEGITAAAYVVVSVKGDSWVLEECGDRDPTGARVGALLQALIALEPAERRPIIRGWLPAGFLPPQVTVASETVSKDLMMLRMLGPAPQVGLSADDLLYWLDDIF